MTQRLLPVIAGCLLLSGCVSRSLTIKTDPPGALVYVNDQLEGKTPVTYDFEWYGWHRVMIRKEGYQRVDDRKKLGAPVYLWIPLDLVMELLPFHLHDDRVWSYTLIAQAEPREPTPPAAPPKKTSSSPVLGQAAPPSGFPKPLEGAGPAPERPKPSPATTEPSDGTR